MIQRIGSHIVRHGDMMDGYDELRSQHGLCDYVYSDPPWGDGNLRYWRTMNKKMNAAAPEVAMIDPNSFDTNVFLSRFFQIVRDSCHDDAVIWIEYGQRWRTEVVTLAARIGLQVMAQAQPVYGSQKLPLDLFVMAFKPRPFPGLTDFSTRLAGVHGFRTLVCATAGFPLRPGETILDPCCGMGYTARLAVRNKMRFVGNELNAARLSKTVAILQRGQG